MLVFMNYKILSCVIFVIIAVTLTFSFTMDFYIQFYNPDWYGIINPTNIDDSSKKKIFILGSSNVHSINATKINTQLSTHQKNYLVYNLADMSDTTTKRITSIDNIISHKPELVLYGIGIWELQKFSTQSYSNLDFLLEPRMIFVSLFENIMDSSIREQIPGSPKDRTLMSLKYIMRGPDHHYHPFIKFDPSPINSYEKIIDEYGYPQSNGLDLTEQNKKIIALKQILQKFEDNGIKVILFSNPQHKIVINSISENEIESFQRMLNQNAHDFEIPVYFFHDSYIDLDIWRDSFHISIHPDAKIYTNDISKIIFKELDNNAI